MKYLVIVITFTLHVSLHAQPSVGIGTRTPDPSAILDISSPNKGLIISPMSQSSRIGIASPPSGLMVYETTSQKMYVFMDGLWRQLINNQYWTKSTTFNRVYSLDSIGIGTAAPAERLDVNGRMLVRDDLSVDEQAAVNDTLRAGIINSNGTLLSQGSAIIDGDITGGDGLIMDHAAPIIQMENSFVNKAFLQLSGDDLRMGINSGNTLGKTIIRMAGNDIIQIDTLAGWTTLLTGAGRGNFSIGHKASRQVASEDNMLPIIYGRINANASVIWMSANASVAKVEIGAYEITCFNARVSGRSSMLVTVGGNQPRIAWATYISPGKFRVDIYDPVGRVFIDADFNFVVHEPLNLL